MRWVVNKFIFQLDFFTIFDHLKEFFDTKEGVGVETTPQKITDPLLKIFGSKLNFRAPARHSQEAATNKRVTETTSGAGYYHKS